VTAAPTTDTFPTETVGLPGCVDSELVEVADGDAFELRIAPVTKRLGDATVRMLAYNGSIPGPTLRVQQGSEVVVNVANEGDLEATVHWHGVRVENRYDGTHETQAPMEVGDSFTYRVHFPIRASTGTTRTSARTTAKSSACTATSSSSRPIPSTGRRSTAS
jgi:FtsP/CotA-like multicopper oxidase with cupredoxin domain